MEYDWRSNTRWLWRSDGTATGTVALVDLGGFASQFIVAGDVVFFLEDDWWRIHRLWRTDGTPPTTRVVYDFGADDSLALGGSLTLGSDGERLVIGVRVRSYFSNDPPLTLWTSDGSETGTAPLQDISRAADAPDSFYDEDAPAFTRSGPHLFFTSAHDGFGRELWALPLSALPPVATDETPTPSPPPTAAPTPLPTRTVTATATSTPTSTAAPRSHSGGGCEIDPGARFGWMMFLPLAVLLLSSEHRRRRAGGV